MAVVGLLLLFATCSKKQPSHIALGKTDMLEVQLLVFAKRLISV
jgi:hypothetical protein